MNPSEETGSSTAPLLPLDDLWQRFANEIRQFAQAKANKIRAIDLTAEAFENELYTRMPAQLSEDQFLPFLYTNGGWFVNDYLRKSKKRAANEVQVDGPDLPGDQSARFERKPERGYYHPYNDVEANTILAALNRLREREYDPNEVTCVDWDCTEHIYVKGSGDLIRLFEQTVLDWLEHPSLQDHTSDTFKNMVARALMGPSLWGKLQPRLQSGQSALSHKLVQVLALGVYRHAKKWYSKRDLEESQKRTLIDRALKALCTEQRLKLWGWPNLLRCLDDSERQVYRWLLEDPSAITLSPKMKAVVAFIHSLSPELEVIDLDRSLHRLEKRDTLAAHWIYQHLFLGLSYGEIAVAHHVEASDVRYKIKTRMEKIRAWMKLPRPEKKS